MVGDGAGHEIAWSEILPSGIPGSLSPGPVVSRFGPASRKRLFIIIPRGFHLREGQRWRGEGQGLWELPNATTPSHRTCRVGCCRGSCIELDRTAWLGDTVDFSIVILNHRLLLSSLDSFGMLPVYWDGYGRRTSSLGQIIHYKLHPTT